MALTCWSLIAVPGTALASQAHVFSMDIGSSGSGAGQVSNPQDVAVNDQTGDIYVADTGNDRVDVFDSAGNFVAAWGDDVDQTTGGNVCTAASGDTCQAGTSSSSPGGFESPEFVAVDNSGGPSQGDVYVADQGDDLVTKFAPDGSVITTWGDGGGSSCGSANGQLSGACAPSGPFFTVAGITVDTSGNLWVYDDNSNMFEFDQDGSYLTGWNSGRGVANNGIAVDSNGNLYVVVGAGNVEQFSSTGTDLGDVSDDQSTGQINGFAVDSSTNDLYADDGGELIRHYDGATLSSCPPSNDCAAAETFGSSDLSGSAFGVGVNSANAAVYVADPGNDNVAVFIIPPAAKPSVDGESVTAVTSTQATLQAQVNPNQLATTCTFQYGTTTSYANSIPCSPADLSSGASYQPVEGYLSGLQSGVTYHYRVVVTNSDGTTDGPDRTFTTYPALQAQSCPNAEYRTGLSAYLPDCRAYEMVSPLDKGGSDVTPTALADPTTFMPWQAATNGNAVAYYSRGAFAGAQGLLPLDPYLARRTDAGWETTSLAPPSNPTNASPNFLVQYSGYPAFSSDLSTGVLSDIDPAGPQLATGAVSGYPNLYLRNTETGAYQALTTVTPPNVPTQDSWSKYELYFQGASSDFSHVVFTATDALTANAPSGCAQGQGCLYEWSNGTLQLVNVLPDGTATGQAVAGGVSSFGYPWEGNLHGAVSTDGTKVYWTNGSGAGEIYVRVDGQSTDTVGDGTFWAAAPDGSEALWQSGGNNPGGDLYVFDLASQSSTDIAPNGDVQGVVGTSSDLSYVYFVADASLASGATSGEPNLYVWHDGSTKLVATLPSGEGQLTSSDGSIGSALPYQHPAYVTPDGQNLAFVSGGQLTGYDNTPVGGTGTCVGDVEASDWGGQCPEVFYYDASTGDLACASCNPSGAQPVGGSTIAPGDFYGYDPHDVTNDGSEVFFTSDDALVPRDSNAQQDVYEWNPSGADGCTLAAGCVSLISGGTGGTNAPGASTATFNEPNFSLNTFVDATPSGSDVFFTTQQQLVPGDTDDASDLYDARVDGGFASAPTAPAPCSGAACRTSSSPPPAPPVTATVTFSGPGDQHGGSSAPRQRTFTRIVRTGAFYIRVRIPSRGLISVRGRWLHRVRRSASHAGTYRLRVRLTRSGRRMLAKRHRLRVKLTVRYQPGYARGAGVSLTSDQQATKTGYEPGGVR